LHWNTIDEFLKKALIHLMKASEFSLFRLVGGTALSLQLGHRISIDIDFFTDMPYGSVNFNMLEDFLHQNFKYVDTDFGIQIGMGKSYLIGENKDQAIKLDIFYTEKFIQPPLLQDGIRLATVEEIIAMKIDVISRKGRKKDFWDIHELIDNYSISQMLDLHKQRYEFTHNESEILANFIDFDNADDDFEPICLRGKYWELVKNDIYERVTSFVKEKDKYQ
jgi:hypothetical protein